MVPFSSEKVCVSQERVSGFPEKRGRELLGKSGKLAANCWIAVKFHSLVAESSATGVDCSCDTPL